jgi:serine kinase of HPr protein (carbohydrate metabolism regulator)
VIEVLRPAADFLVARCPELLREHLETRALGVLNLRRLYGQRAIAPLQRLDLVIELAASAEPSGSDRIRGRRTSIKILGVDIPRISMHARVGHNLGVLVEAACRDHWLRLFGYRSDEDFSARQAAAIQRDQET